ncbi:MAG: FtsW/RodA/SpoVE family cell cycle protein [Bacteroidales bacterium]|nr:FtsW/RodA/SpoVE family cell cycle protein [Bacteroidales bacterium]
MKLALKGNKVIWLQLLLLFVASCAMVYSSCVSLALRAGNPPIIIVLKHIAHYLIGFAVLLGCYFIIPMKWWRTLSIPAAIFIAVALVLAKVVGNGRSINIGFDFQPSEFAKTSTVLFLAWVLENKKLETFKEYAFWVLAPLGVTLLLCLMGSASATILIALIAGVILVSAQIKKRFLLYTAGIALAAILAIIGLHYSLKGLGGDSPFGRIDTVVARMERFFDNRDETTLSPEERAEKKTKEFQQETAQMAIQLGAFGKAKGPQGPGGSITREKLPNAFDDYIFCVIVEEWGILGAIAIILIYLTLFYQCILIARRCTQTYSTVTVLGLSFMIVLQAMLHILVNIGAFPVTGQTLPMISRGGSATLSVSIALGIILSINRSLDNQDQAKLAETEVAVTEEVPDMPPIEIISNEETSEDNEIREF